MTLLSTAVSRTRRPIPAQIRPSPVHEKVDDADDDRDRRPGRDGHVDADDEAGDEQRERGDEHRVGDHRQRAAEEERQPPGGCDEDVRQRLLVALARDRMGHREEARDRRVLDGVSDHVELVRLDARTSPDVDEQQDLEDGGDDQGGEEDPRREPVDEAPVRGQPADEEDAERDRHVSERLALRRAARRTLSVTRIPIAT